ncbi:hypothetical protein HN51_059329 [Arachis hypogaea]|uniref:probable WRKY transcription factor 50 n=1 Tax=Arachis ipaensis TaxID=130454 RepID=UPI000A2B3808|nr:probable WRKY transcription factor 50 [Arachis ipaensis]QHN82730.1 putative WRKY transcription factor [Arachis hypogaea]
MEDYYFGNPNYSNPNCAHSFVTMATPTSDFMLSDYLLLDDDVIMIDNHHQHQDQESWSQSTESSSLAAASSNVNHEFGGATTSSHNNNIKCKNNVSKRNKQVEARQRVVFRTRSELEVMDDGFKWRKYGKKSVKNSPNPRNYYKCSSVGCGVKKRVERDAEDRSYVLTSYDGVHNHQSPSSNSYYTTSPFSIFHSNDINWSLHAPAVNSSSSNS